MIARSCRSVALLSAALASFAAFACAPSLSAQATTTDTAGAHDTTARPAPKRARRVPVTPELARTAFADARARTLLERAREARIAQDSALAAYDAKTYQRLTIGMEVRRTGIERLLLRAENAAHVRWSRRAGMWIEPTGRRAVSGMFREAALGMELTSATPVPYFPGREALWIPSAYIQGAQAEVSEEDVLHPLATGAEAYYRYATGDSVGIRLPDGRRVSLRELRITARRPQWRAFVGSFWFDADQGHLVRAVYRLSTEVDFWQQMSEDQRRAIEDLDKIAASDTSAEARKAREVLGEEATKRVSLLAKAMLSPLRANVSAITVEYTLYEGRFWLPKLQTAEGEVQAGFLRIPLKVEESFRYNSVNVDPGIAPVGSPVQYGFTEADTMWSGSLQIGSAEGDAARRDTSAAAVREREDERIDRYTLRADTLRRSADSAHAAGDTAQARAFRRRADYNVSLARRIEIRRERCARDSTYVAGIRTRYQGAIRVAVLMPCDESKLARSPDLESSIYEQGDLFDAAAVDELLNSLDFGLQPGWGPQRPKLHSGLDLVRYNRIEGLSVGATATSVLGFGYAAQALVRIGTADRMPNGELSLIRSNGRADLRLGFFHRLGVANDDWGSPLSFGASVANALYARDEGFYYRTWGVELGGTRAAPGPFSGARLGWRLFVERQRSAGDDPRTSASLAGLFGDSDFERNIDAQRLNALGAGLDLVRTFGTNPLGARLATRARTEAAYTNRDDSVGSSGYGRLVLDATLSRGLGPVAAAITGAAGTSAGDLPLQRAFYVGGLQTVRGQFARPDTSAGSGRVGDAFWLARAELGMGVVMARPSVFYDVGWAGRRDDFGAAGRRPLSGAGVGVSFLDGLVRFDVSRGIHPEKRWRADMYLEARF